MAFTHLQVRTGYSIMKSTITIEKLIDQASRLQFNALALTDEHVLYGAIPFYKACRKNNIKPIIGMAVNVANGDDQLGSCLLLAKNNQGYSNLLKISTEIQLSQKESIQTAELALYSNGLICILPTVDTRLEHVLVHKTHEQVKAELDANWSMFTPDNFYLGIQNHGLENERQVIKELRSFCKANQVQAALINDVRYLEEKDDAAYDCLRTMQREKKWPLRITDTTIKNRYLRSAEEMESLFLNDWPEVIQATETIAANCNVIIDFNKRMLPSYPVPENTDAHTYLEQLCREKMKQRYAQMTDKLVERLEYELETIKTMQFSDYFLIVWDFITYARTNNILVGPGRGSAAGSLVSYVLGITDVDPIKHELLFERFLNPERVTMPDIDIDFSDHRRDEVIEYVRKKYGEEHVAQIITFGTFAARSLLRDLMKTLDVDQQDIYFILKEIPVQAKKTIPEHVKESPDLYQYVKQSPKLRALFAIAAKLEGLPRHISTHAAGVVISDEALVKHVPLTVGTHDTYLSQFPMNELEELGLLKMDFLGLRNLTLLERILAAIKYTDGKRIAISNIPENDGKTYQLLQNGKTNGVFQLESQGMKRVLMKLKPTTFEDIVAVNALFRPGPMENIPVYIARKHGAEKTQYPHPDLQPILAKTYGVLIYQEQIMQIAHKIGAFTLGQADILRRAVSKKDQQTMDKLRKDFTDGCVRNGYSQKVAEEIFAWIIKFANYGFNRSHAVAYSEISYQLAYLKAHYPGAFFAELLSSVANQQDKIQAYVKELKELGLTLDAPSINYSFGKYTVYQNRIRMGFSTIKGIGNNVTKEIIRVRKEKRFSSLFDFCLRMPSKVISRNTLETLIMAGTFDELYQNRASLLASIDQALEQGELFKEFTEQSNLFDDILDLEENYVAIEDFNLMKKLQDEKDLLGIYVSSHPLENYRQMLTAYGYTPITNIPSLVGRKDLKAAAVVQAIKVIRTKRGDPMAFMTAGDETGDIETVVFPDLYRNVHRWLEEGMLVTLRAKVESRNDSVQLLLSEINKFDENEWSKKPQQRLFIKLTEENSDNGLAVLYKIAQRHKGNTTVIVHYETTKTTYRLTADYWVEPNEYCMRLLRERFGAENVVLENTE